jgi:hypothetical protein
MRVALFCKVLVSHAGICQCFGDSLVAGVAAQMAKADAKVPQDDGEHDEKGRMPAGAHTAGFLVRRDHRTISFGLGLLHNRSMFVLTNTVKRHNRACTGFILCNATSRKLVAHETV